MKKILIVFAVSLVAIAALSAQVGPMMGRGYGFAQQATPVAPPKGASIEGKLVFLDGYPALQAKDKTYYLHMPQFFRYAYTDGIKEGASIKADGYELPALPGQDKPAFMVTKATIGSKTYDFTTPGAAGGMMRGFMGRTGDQGPMGGRGMMGGRGAQGGRGGRW